jgi:hypothetical protein
VPISVGDFGGNVHHLGSVVHGMNELQFPGIESQRNVFLSRVATIQAENEALGRRENKFDFFFDWDQRYRSTQFFLLEAGSNSNTNSRHPHHPFPALSLGLITRTYP